jgi:hypothetical protein
MKKPRLLARAPRREDTARERINVLDEIAVIGVTEGPLKGWVHTVGMARFGRAELEIRGVPLFLHPMACGLLNEVCDYILNEPKEVRVGERMQIGPCLFRIVASEPMEGADEILHETPHWRLDDEPLVGRCALHGMPHPPGEPCPGRPS